MAYEEKTIDSNTSGARIAEEAQPGILADGSADYPGTPQWDALEPNSYDDFGGSVTTKARTPISQTRQRKKGTPISLSASGGFNQDFTETGMLKLMQGFLFADAHIPADTKPITGTSVTLTTTSVVDSSVSAAAGLEIFATDDIVLLSGFGVASNNGVKTVASAIAGKVTFDEAMVTEAVLPASARIQKVGVKGTDIAVVVNGTQIDLTSAGSVDFTTLGLVAGAWIFIGSDANAFATPANQCFARVDAITATAITLGKTTKQMVAEAATSVDILLPVFVRNEPNPDDIKRRTYQIERTVGRDADGVMSEYLIDARPNEFKLSVPSEDFVSADLSFSAADNEQRTGAEGVKAGTRPSLPIEDVFNTSSDVRRLRLSVITEGNPFPAALFGYATEAEIMVNNNVKANPALGVLGALSMTAGTFDVGGSLTVYFARMEAVKAVRDNSDVTMDMILVKNNGGWVFDIPLLALGDGRLNVEANEAITLPLETTAAESVQGHTLMLARFAYLPDLA